MSFFSKKNKQGDSTVQLQNLEQPDDDGRHTPRGQSWSGGSYQPVDLADLDSQGSGVGKVNMPTIQQGLSTILGLRSMGQNTLPPITNKTSQRRYFFDDMSHLTRTKVFTAKAEERPGYFVPDENDVLSLPHDTYAFKFDAHFDYCPRGYYDIVWKLQPTQDFRSPNGFHFSVKVFYEGEPDMSGSMEIALGQNTLQGLTKGKWHYLILEDQLVIHPHAKRAWAVLSLSNNENELSQHYSGLLIEHVELRPSGTKVQTPDTLNVMVRDGPRAIGMVDTSNAPAGTEHISRLAFSQDSEYLAALTLLENEARVQVWNLVELRSMRGPRCNASKMGAVAHIHHPGVQDLAIGLSISATGDQIAVFQEPRIGDWEAGSEIPKASFPFTLFLNPLIKQETSVVDMESVKSASGKTPLSPDGPTFSKSRNASATSPPEGLMELIRFGYESSHLQNIVGYCTFLGQTKENDDADTNINGDGEEPTTNINKTLPKFVACNGSYLDIFTIDGTRWKHNQTITLSNLAPTLSRRITCKMMIDSMSPTMFMWLEDGGLNCATWNLLTGSNVSHIHSVENASFKGPTFRGHNKMAISPHESIAALASVDGSLTTYFIKSGMAIDDRKFPGYKIEYVGFHSQDDQLFVVLRNTGTRQLSARILDSLQLRSEVDAYQVPIPTIGSTIVAFMRRRGFFGRGIVCSAVGSRLRFHWTQAPSTIKMDKRNEDVVRADPTEVEFESVFDENISYRLNTTPIRISSPGGEGKSYWLQRVELLQISMDTQVMKQVFAFCPEPWTRWATLDYTNPDALISTYFMPCGTRFVVVGTQTVQVWNLPRHDEPRVSLQFVFSKPVEDPKDIENYKLVGNYYEIIETATFYQDIRHRTALMEITMATNTRLKKVSIPGPLGAGARLAIVHAFRSVHLLAAMYMFSIRDYQTIANQLHYSFTFEEHADGIGRFVKSHINRMSSLGNLCPWEFTRANPESKSDPSRKKQDVTSILMVLLDERHLRETNYSFIMSLLSESNGEWIPRDHKFLNPILRAISRRDRLLVESFLDYCVANAKKYHPSYLMPAVQCVEELANRYPELLADLFRRASYISAHNHAYVSTHAIVANPDVRFRFWKERSQEYTDYARPVFHLRSQLPTRGTTSWFNIKNIESNYSGRRETTFPDDDTEAQRLREERVAAGEYNHKIYVAPFPKLSAYGPYVPWYKGNVPESPFSRIAGLDLFDSPAMTAVLEFKWHKFGFKSWIKRIFYLLVYYGIFLFITGFQIAYYVDPPRDGENLDRQQLENRYMRSTGWNTAIRIDIALGTLMLLMEFAEITSNGWDYFRSPYNYIDVLAEVLPLISCWKLLSRPENPDFLADDYEEPKQIWWMSFSILTIYMHLLFELRVFKQLGIVVNTIVKITLRTAWFLVVMALFLVGFTHALLHLLHTQPASGSAGKFTLSNGTGYPTSAPLALSATYFFLGGRWDPLDQNFDGDEGSFHVMMFIFFFFTAILLLNLLIALMNDAYNDSQQEGEQAWLRQWSVIIANVEKTYLSPSEIHNSNTFPDFVYYGAPEEEAEAYESKFAITSKANLSIENQFLIDQFTGEQRATLATHRSIQRDVSNLQQSYERLRRTQESVQKNMLTITALVGHCYRILGSPSQETPADETADGENPAEVEDGETDEEEEEEEEYDEDDGGQLEEGLEYEQDQDEGLVYEDENENSNAGADIEEMVDIDPDRKKPVLADTETNVDPYSKEKKSSQQAEERMPRPHARMRKSSQHAEERKTSRITEDDKGSIDLPAPASTIPTPTPPLLSSPSSSGPRPTPGFSRTAPQQVPPPMADSNARPPPPSSLPTPSSSAGPPPPAPGFSRKAPQHPPLPSSGAIVQPPLPAPPLPVSAITAPSADPVLPPPPQSASPITASPTELEQGGSPMPIAERIPVHDPSSSRLKKKTTATTPARAPPRNAPTAPGRVTHSPADTDPLSSPYGAHPAQPSSRVPFDHGQLPGPSMSMPVLVGDNASGWPAYLPPSQQHRPQAQWNPITNPAEMQARIESSYLRRKKRKNVTKAGAGGAATDASSAAEDDATSLRSLPLETPAASSSSSQVRQRNRRREAGGSSSAPSSRRLDQRELSGRRMTDSATTGSTPVQRSPLAESRVRQRDDDDAQEQHRIEYLDMEDENAI